MGVVGLLVIATAALVVLELSGVVVWPRDPDSWKSITYSSQKQAGVSQLYYPRRVPDENARKIGDFLERAGFFNTPNPVGVYYRPREGNQHRFSFFFDETTFFQNEEPTLAQFEDLRLRMNQELFRNKAVVFELCDQNIRIEFGKLQFKILRLLPQPR